MHCKQPSQVLPAIVHPTKCCTQHTYSNVVQPQIHPAHTTIVNHTNVQNQHYFPQSKSVQQQVTSQDINMGPGPGYGPGHVAGAYMPGPGPGLVAGAHMPPNMHMPGHVAGAMAPNQQPPGFGGYRKRY